MRLISAEAGLILGKGQKHAQTDSKYSSGKGNLTQEHELGPIPSDGFSTEVTDDVVRFWDALKREGTEWKYRRGKHSAALAQLVERGHANPKAIGSIPLCLFLSSLDPRTTRRMRNTVQGLGLVFSGNDAHKQFLVSRCGNRVNHSVAED